MNLLEVVKRPSTVEMLLPLSLGKENTIAYLGSLKLFTDMESAGWIYPLPGSGHKFILYDRELLDKAFARLRAGEYPEGKK